MSKYEGKIFFTKHALQRLSRLNFWKNPKKNLNAAIRLLLRAEKVYTESSTGITHWRRGIYRFIVKEHKHSANVITILRDSF